MSNGTNRLKRILAEQDRMLAHPGRNSLAIVLVLGVLWLDFSARTAELPAQEAESAPVGPSAAEVLPKAPPEGIRARGAQGDYALRFNGTHCVELANSEEVASMNKECTVELWVRWRRIGVDADFGQSIVGTYGLARDRVGGFPDERNPRDTAFAGWCLGLQSHRGAPNLIVHVSGANGRGATGWKNPVPTTPQDWRHIALVRTADGEFIYFYDGKRLGVRRQEFIPIADNLFLGWMAYTESGSSLARDFACYADVRAMRLSTVARYEEDFDPGERYQFTKDQHTAILLDFSRPTPEAIRDASGNDHHGKFLGVKWIELAPTDAAP